MMMGFVHHSNENTLIWSFSIQLFRDHCKSLSRVRSRLGAYSSAAAPREMGIVSYSLHLCEKTSCRENNISCWPIILPQLFSTFSKHCVWIADDVDQIIDLLVTVKCAKGFFFFFKPPLSPPLQPTRRPLHNIQECGLFTFAYVSLWIFHYACGY